MRSDVAGRKPPRLVRVGERCSPESEQVSAAAVLATAKAELIGAICASCHCTLLQTVNSTVRADLPCSSSRSAGLSSELGAEGGGGGNGSRNVLGDGDGCELGRWILQECARNRLEQGHVPYPHT